MEQIIKDLKILLQKQNKLFLFNVFAIMFCLVFLFYDIHLDFLFGVIVQAFYLGALTVCLYSNIRMKKELKTELEKRQTMYAAETVQKGE